MNRFAQHATSQRLGRSWKPLLRHWDVIPFLSIHLMCLWAFQTGVRLEWVLLAIGSYYVRMFGVTAGYHRYFAHRSYKTSRIFQFLLAFLAMTSAQKGVLWWAAHHRHHHKYSDQEADFHSPLQRGFWFSHVGWILSEKYARTDWPLVRDFSRYPEICFLNRFYFIPPLLYALLIYIIWGFPGLVWGFFISTTALYHCTFFINSLTHLIGRVRYKSNDGSKNSFVLRCSVVEKAGTTITITISRPSIRDGFGGKWTCPITSCRCCPGSESSGISESLPTTSKPEPLPSSVAATLSASGQ